MSELSVTARAGGVRFAVQVKPRSSRSKVLGVKEGALVVALQAPPVEGAANAELVELVAQALGVRRGDVSIAAGASSKKKLVEVQGIGEEQVRARLSRLQ